MLGRASEAAPTIHIMGTVASYPRNSEIFGEGEPADCLYNVINGGVRTYKIFSDGRRQIGGFYLPGDVVGLECPSAHLLGGSDCRHEAARDQARRARGPRRPRS